MTRLAQVLIGAAWFVATVGVAFTWFGRTINLGFACAIAIGFAAAATNWRSLSALSIRAVLPASGLAALAFVVPALAQGPGVSLSAGRGCLAIAWLVLLLGLGAETVRPALVGAAVALLVGNLLLAVSSLAFRGSLEVFERAQHEYASLAPRFRGLANTPAPAGVWALVGIGLIEASPRPRVRWAARALGVLEACATLSIALLAVPALLASLIPQRWLRWPLVGCATAMAAAVLYFQPLQLSIGGRTLSVSKELPEYWRAGLGPEHMPYETIGVPGLAARGHMTAYGKLALRGLTCFAEHPIVGVGPGRFRESCRVMAMNTFGEWSDQRDAHNQVGGVLSELGLVGIVLLGLAWSVARGDYRFTALTTWQRAVWVGLLVCSLGSEDLLTLPVLALFGSQLALRTPSRVS